MSSTRQIIIAHGIALMAAIGPAIAQIDTMRVKYGSIMRADTNELKEGDQVVLVKRYGRYCQVNKTGIIGYVLCGNLDKGDTATEQDGKSLSGAEILKQLEARGKQVAEDYHKKQSGIDPERRDALIRKYGSTKGTKIYEREIWVGMTSQMARDSWGEPDNINRTGNANGVREQWVYKPGSYLYFENGVLTAWQN